MDLAARASLTGRRFRLISAAIAGLCLVGALAGFGVQKTATAPVQERLLAGEARRVGDRIDQIVKMRTLAVDMLTNGSPEELLKPGGVDGVIRSMQKMFPDFTSIEVFNQAGDLQAVGGDIVVSDKGIPTRLSFQLLAELERLGNDGKILFKDDPTDGCFFLIRLQTDTDGAAWITRSRFSRRPIEETISKTAARIDLEVKLSPHADSSSDGEWAVTAGAASLDEGPVGGSAIRVTGGWWSGPKQAETLLQTPGWLVSVSGRSMNARFAKTSAFIALSALLLLMASAFLTRFGPLPAGAGALNPLLKRMGFLRVPQTDSARVGWSALHHRPSNANENVGEGKRRTEQESQVQPAIVQQPQPKLEDPEIDHELYEIMLQACGKASIEGQEEPRTAEIPSNAAGESRMVLEQTSIEAENDYRKPSSPMERVEAKPASQPTEIETNQTDDTEGLSASDEAPDGVGLGLPEDAVPYALPMSEEAVPDSEPTESRSTEGTTDCAAGPGLDANPTESPAASADESLEESDEVLVGYAAETD
ncbi:MAG: hypothetical protein V2B18_20415, partial [Pseudomonadota bacterium]